MTPAVCSDLGGSSFLMGAITGMVTAWVIVIYLAIVKREDNK